MKFSTTAAVSILFTLLPTLTTAHCVAQRVRVNGVDKGLLNGIRTPTSNNPIQNVNDANMACNSGFSSPVSKTVIDVRAGDAVGVLWGHVIGGAQFAGDKDNPIAGSHKGPTTFYLAAVPDPASASPSNQKWFKITEDGLDTSTGKWGVDRMIATGGWADFVMPACVPTGTYLLRAEIVALHSAGKSGGAQFYMGCAHINLTSGGGGSAQTVSFPGAYSANDPGILVSIYDKQGQPVGNGQPYQIPGPAKIKC